MAELKPCPQCGVPPHIGYCCGEYFIYGDDPECPYCGNSFTEMHASEQGEIEAWNRREEKMANKKRLTEKHYSGEGYYLKCSSDCPNNNVCDYCEKLYKAIDRLGEYEDNAEKTVDAVEVVHARWGNGHCTSIM